MKIYDISKEIFELKVGLNDKKPEREILYSMENGSEFNLTAFSMCAHNGTHVDVPYHFFKDGATVEQLDLKKVVGQAYVFNHQGNVSAEDAENMIKKASPEARKRIIIKGDAVVTEAAAKVFAEAKVSLVGNEAQAVGPAEYPHDVHRILLSANVVLLEGLVLSDVQEGEYLLCAAPLNLKGSDGSPCRALLIENN